MLCLVHGGVFAFTGSLLGSVARSSEGWRTWLCVGMLLGFVVGEAAAMQEHLNFGGSVMSGRFGEMVCYVGIGRNIFAYSLMYVRIPFTIFFVTAL
jgi:hypothetical protein